LLTEGEDRPTPTPRDQWWTVGLAALLIVPLVVSAVYLWFSVGDDYFPSTDWAIFELRARDAFDHGVYVGPYSRFGWNHPGPILFYLLGGAYKALGSKSISLHITALFVNGVTIGLIAWVAFRRGRLPMVVAVLVPVALMTHAMGADDLRNPWNPYLPVLPLLLLLLLCWSVAVGDLWMLPIAVAVSTFAIQSHVGLALESVAFVAVALVGIVWHGWRRPAAERRRWWLHVAKAVGVSAIVLAVLWFPVFWGTVVKGDGNLGSILEFFRKPHDTAGLTEALEVFGLQWGPRPEWIVGERGLDTLGTQYMEDYWWVAIGLGLGVAATVVAIRRRSFDTVWLAVMLAVGFPVGVLAVSNIVDIVFPYLTRWTWVLGAALGILVLRGAWLAVPTARREAAIRWVVPVAAAILVVVSVAGTVDALDAGTPSEREQAAERSITRQVLEHLPPGDGPVLIDISEGGIVAPGIALALERHGIPTRITPDSIVVYGKERLARGGPYRATIMPVLGDEKIRELTPPGPRIAYYVRQQNAADRRAIRQHLRYARELPAGPSRDQFIALLERGREGPAEEIAVYLVQPGG
jgi:hypothetical protein